MQSLSLFLNAEERKRSSLAAPLSEYVPDLILQGLHSVRTPRFAYTRCASLRLHTLRLRAARYTVAESAQSAAIKDEQVILSMLPTTLVNLDTHTVRQTHPSHEYNVLRSEFMKLEIDHLLEVAHRDTLWSSQDGLFKPLKAVAPCIAKMLQDLFMLPLSLREGFLLNSMRILTRKAIVLVKYVDAEL